MKNLVLSALALSAAWVLPGAASADEASERTAAIRLCGAEISAQSGVDRLRVDQMRVRRRFVRIDFDLWRDGRLHNVRCDVTRSHGQLAIASIRPTLQLAAAH